jgi:hypothetical protein
VEVFVSVSFLNTLPHKVIRKIQLQEASSGLMFSCHTLCVTFVTDSK